MATQGETIMPTVPIETLNFENPERVAGYLEQLIKAVADMAAPSYRIIVREGELMCVAVVDMKTSDNLLTSLTAKQVRHGLTSNEWLRLSELIINHRRSILCLQLKSTH